jgi:RNA polymerase sigma-70 factor (ECF subfamily)
MLVAASMNLESPEKSALAGLPSEALGSPELEAIYREHARSVYYLALRMLGEAAQAEDAAHDIFLKVFRKFSQFEGNSTIRTWLYRITINHCQNILRSWHHRNIQGGDENFLEKIGPQTETPLRVLEIKELGGQIQKALDALPEEYRLLILLVADEKLSYDEVGVLTSQSSDAVRGKLHRARKAFAIAFKQLA